MEPRQSCSLLSGLIIERYQRLYSEVQLMSLRVTKVHLSLEVGRAIELTGEEESEAGVGCIAKSLT